MENFKGMFSSKTVWGGIISIAAGITGIIGYTITPIDQDTLATLIAASVSSIGGIVAIVGRCLAKKKIG